MKFSRWTFLIAAIFGILVLVPQYFLIEKYGVDSPPPVNHPEFYYGFTGIALAFQVVFLFIASDPLRYRPIILAAIAEKFSFGIATMVLFAKEMVAGPIVAGAAIDLALGLLFIVSYVKLSREPGA